MAYRVTQRIISSDDPLYPYFDDLCRKSKLLYNAALFRVRNIFTGYDKEHRTENEVEVFQEVALLQRSYPNMHVRRVISYTHLEKDDACHRECRFLFRTSKTDSTADGQTVSHRFQKLACFFKNIKSIQKSIWVSLRCLAIRKVGPDDCDHHKPGCCLVSGRYRDVLKTAFAKATLVLFKSFFGSCIKRSQDQTVLWSFLLCLTLEEPDVAFDPSDLMYSVPLILEQITSQRSYVMITHPQYTKGGAVLSKIQWFHKQRAKYVSIITKGHEKKHAVSRKQDFSFHYANFVERPVPQDQS